MVASLLLGSGGHGRDNPKLSAKPRVHHTVDSDKTLEQLGWMKPNTGGQTQQLDTPFTMRINNLLVVGSCPLQRSDRAV